MKGLVTKQALSFFLAIPTYQPCYFLFLEKKKVTKENSRQTRCLRPFCQANASLCVSCFCTQNVRPFKRFGDRITLHRLH